MIIILEGPDGSGKSTLASQLNSSTGWPVIHRSTPKNDEEKQQMYNMYKQAILEGANVIFDRAWYSEMVYGPVMREERILSIAQMYDLEELLVANNGGLIIYCTGEPRAMWDRCRARGEDYVTGPFTFGIICEGYDALFVETKHKIPVVRYTLDETPYGTQD